MEIHCGDASLMTLKFVSRPDASLTAVSLNRVVCQAWAYNVRAGITGEIALRDGMFHQTLEGLFEIIVPLASRILSDCRHHHITIERFGSIPTRAYDCWNSIGFQTLLPETVSSDSLNRIVRVLPNCLPVAEELRGRKAYASAQNHIT